MTTSRETAVAFAQAFKASRIEEPEDDIVLSSVDALVAGGYPVAPPAAWFANPELKAPTPLVITDEGRVYGHIASFDLCHIGIGTGRCFTAPRSQHGYRYFTTGYLQTAEGSQVSVGQITVGTGHADLKLGVRPAKDHYDHTGTAVCDVACGADEYGIWVAGALRPSATPEQVRILRASPPSGDWREIRGNLELVAALSVNVQGYPIPRISGFVAGGELQSLVAAGALAAVEHSNGEALPEEELEAPKRMIELSAEDFARIQQGVEDSRRRRAERLASKLKTFRKEN